MSMNQDGQEEFTLNKKRVQKDLSFRQSGSFDQPDLKKISIIDVNVSFQNMREDDSMKLSEGGLIEAAGGDSMIIQEQASAQYFKPKDDHLLQQYISSPFNEEQEDENEEEEDENIKEEDQSMQQIESQFRTKIGSDFYSCFCCKQTFQSKEQYSIHQKFCYFNCPQCNSKELYTEKKTHDLYCRQIKTQIEEQNLEQLIQSEKCVIEQQQSNLCELIQEVRSQQLESQQKASKLQKLKLFIIFLIFLQAIHAFQYRESLKESRQLLHDIADLIGKAETKHKFESMHREFDLQSIEIYLLESLELLKKQVSYKFQPPILEDKRFVINQYRDQLTKQELYEEILTQMIFFNGTIFAKSSIGDSNYQQGLYQIQCYPSKLSLMGRECLLGKKLIQESKGKMIKLFAKYIMQNVKDQDQVEILFRNFIDQFIDQTNIIELKECLGELKRIIGFN